MFAIETTSRVKFIFTKEEASKILLIANFSLRYTCHRTKIFKYPVFLPFGRNFFEQRNANENIISHFWLNLKRASFRPGLSSRNKNFMLCFSFDKVTCHVTSRSLKNSSPLTLCYHENAVCTLFAQKNLLEICRQEQFYGATWINGNPYYHTKLLCTSNLKLYPKVIVTSVRMVKSMSFRSNFFKCLL